ncbi:hypothetical protein [Sporosarcina sp.]|uniref:hypothetical protein n=1 Tax=Sporosarcina sp. TaxID=49982 RepID=UPI002608A1D4|nr:hypothetical protein [Sporosarcina sp.]
MTKSGISIAVCMLTATVLGVYGQWIARFLTDEPMKALYYLTACTVISMILYTVSYIFAFVWLKNNQMNVWKMTGVFLVIVIIAVPVSMFSFLATVMWWG